MKLSNLKRVMVDRCRSAMRMDQSLSESTKIRRLLRALLMKFIKLGASFVNKAAVKRYQVTIAPIVDIPFPAVDLSRPEPLSVMASSPELAQAEQIFLSNLGGTRSLISASAHTWLYALVRNLRPEHVIEIGTYMAGTSETICRALHGNGRGLLHTTDPFGTIRVPAVLSQWPRELRQHIRFYALDSMAFFSEMMKQPQCRPDLVFVDGNHDYEFAAFDIASAARILRPGGFIAVDNVSQAGPFFAARDFLASHPQWRECRVNDRPQDTTKAFDRDRSNIPGTDLMLLRAPTSYLVGDRPVTWGESTLRATALRGIVVPLGDVEGRGTLHVQGVLRGFSGKSEAVELVDSASQSVSDADASTNLTINLPMALGPDFEIARFEIWLTWIGSRSLPIREPPSAMC